MSNDLIKVGYTQENWNKYTVEISHKGLNINKIISAPDREMLQNKVDLQVNKWSKKWESIERTKEAISALNSIDMECKCK